MGRSLSKDQCLRTLGGIPGVKIKDFKIVVNPDVFPGFGNKSWGMIDYLNKQHGYVLDQESYNDWCSR